MNDQQLMRYSRHIMLGQMDYEGQQRLLESHVLVLGLGGLGSSGSYYLAASGVGKLTLVDPDVVEDSNLQRQIIHNEDRVGALKVASAKTTLQKLNSDILIDTYQTLEADELSKLIASVDLVLDCTDNSKSRMMHNEFCVKHKTPLVSAAAIGLNGQLMLVDSSLPNAPCYACVYPELDDSQLSCNEAGILSPVVGMMGVMQSLEAIKYLAQIGQTSAGKLITFDALTSQWHSFNAQKRPACSVCSQL
ncbi:HesA/MoeB/ThiF family protein [Bermanella sp. R86510]|uniref:HesA/MoeB/ThiF family protein n=1 Tax=unclassified Bermanella TaxID=2627862 RepID=UPI0037C8FDF0